MSGLEPKLVTGLGFLFGVALGGALVAWMRGQSIVAGRRCRRCAASLSPVTSAPLLSWFGIRPRCPACSLAAPWRQAAVDTAVVLLGLIAIFAVPLPWALFVPAAAFLAFALAMRRWG